MCVSVLVILSLPTVHCTLSLVWLGPWFVVVRRDFSLISQQLMLNWSPSWTQSPIILFLLGLVVDVSRTRIPVEHVLTGAVAIVNDRASDSLRFTQNVLMIKRRLVRPYAPITSDPMSAHLRTKHIALQSITRQTFIRKTPLTGSGVALQPVTFRRSTPTRGEKFCGVALVEILYWGGYGAYD